MKIEDNVPITTPKIIAKGEAADTVTTQHEDTQQYDQCKWSIDGTSQSSIQWIIKQLHTVTFRIQTEELTDTVKR